MIQLLPTQAGRPSCAPDTAFVTVLSNETYVPGALCLKHTLQQQGSVCPLYLVIDAASIGPRSRDLLAGSYGSSRLLPLTVLLHRISNHSSGTGPGRQLSGARLMPTAGWAKGTQQKLMLWAFPGYKRAVFLDIDLLVVANVDSLSWQEPFAGKHGCMCCCCGYSASRSPQRSYARRMWPCSGARVACGRWHAAVRMHMRGAGAGETGVGVAGRASSAR